MAIESQTLLDAAYYQRQHAAFERRGRSGLRPPFDPSLAALSPVLDGKQQVAGFLEARKCGRIIAETPRRDSALHFANPQERLRKLECQSAIVLALARQSVQVFERARDE